MNDALDSLTVLAMAGTAAEVIAYGGTAFSSLQSAQTDVDELKALLADVSPPITAKTEVDNRIRWGMLTALSMLQSKKGCLDDLAGQLERTEGDVYRRCIQAIESWRMLP